MVLEARVSEKAKKTVMWFKTDIMAMCVKHDYYNDGSNDDYQSLLRYVDITSPSNDAIYNVAYDIAVHTDNDDSFEDRLEMILHHIETEATNTFWRIYR